MLPPQGSWEAHTDNSKLHNGDAAAASHVIGSASSAIAAGLGGRHLQVFCLCMSTQYRHLSCARPPTVALLMDALRTCLDCSAMHVQHGRALLPR